MTWNFRFYNDCGIEYMQYSIVYCVLHVFSPRTVLCLLHVPFAELSLPLAWIGHDFYGHAIQYAYMADSVFLLVFVDFAIWD